jgi:hypothetical protein
MLSAVVVTLASGCGCGPQEHPTDAGLTDAGATDAGTPDAGTPDAGAPDAGERDAGAPDAGTTDAGTTDAGTSCTLDAGATGTLCGSACVDLTTDPQHCGTCQQVCTPGSICNGQCQDVVASLDGLRWELACLGPIRADGFTCDSPPSFTTSTQVHGADGGRYDVVLHFRGVVEQRTYTAAADGGAIGAQADGGLNPEFFVEGSTVATSDPYNVYTLSVDYPVSGRPTKLFRLNSGVSYLHACDRIDYFATIAVEAGSTLLLTADSIESSIVANLDTLGQPFVVPDVPPAPQPFDGQFVQIDVVSVTAAP